MAKKVGFFSQALISVCDEKYKFIFTEVRQNGRSNDRAVLRNSELGIHSSNHIYYIPSKEVAEENYFKDRGAFLLPYYMAGD